MHWAPPHGWADTLDAATLESNRTDLQRAILPTAPAGIMQDIVPVEPLKDGIARITVEVDRNNVPADGQSPVKLRIRAFDADNQGVMGETLRQCRSLGRTPAAAWCPER